MTRPPGAADKAPPMQNPSALEAVLRRDRAIVLASLVGVVALAWIYLALGYGHTGMDRMDMATDMWAMAPAPHPGGWTATEVALTFVMWAVMMTGMMVPSAAPMILIHAAAARRQHPTARPFGATGAFTLGYVVVWAGFSLAATALQAGLDRLALLDPSLSMNSPRLAAAVLIAAGVYQLTPLKHVCLAHCRAPLHFIARRWRAGTGGAFRMGIEHGAYCLGCCWVLMVLLFVGGVMNLLTVAAVAGFVLLEKLLPGGERLGRIGGAALIGAGLAMIVV